MKPLDILVVDDERDIRTLLRETLSEAGHTVSVASNGAEGLSLIAAHLYDVVITDIRMPKVDGLTLFRRVRVESPTTEVILMTGSGSVANAVAALKEGALDYLAKPFDVAELLILIDRIAGQRTLRHELQEARAALSASRTSPPIIGNSLALLRHMKRIDIVARSHAPVLITGESGTGKELVARALHERSPRAAHPFVAVNCAAFPDGLLEAELFGHERGAFTGAVKRREGRFKSAAGGTLFLDEIAEIPLSAQAKLLRALQEGTVQPLGTNETFTVDVRIVSATHRNLKERIADGRFREDLYYRLNVLNIDVPPLRERRGDLSVLWQHFLQKYTAPGRGAPAMSPRAWALLSHHAWPGNVRELSHAVEHATVLSGGAEIGVEHLPSSIRGTADESVAPGDQEIRSLHVSLKEFEREYLMRALEQSGGKRGKAADILGICRKNLWEKMCQHGIAVGETEELADLAMPPEAPAGVPAS